jgi:hypothetical protein
MQIQDFHSKLTSKCEEGHLFQALRNLSLVEDVRAMFVEGTDNILVDWGAWPPAGDGALSLAAQA